MNTNRKTAIKENKMKITTSNLIRWSGLAAMGSGIIFIAIQPIHPLDILSSVTTSTWAIVQSLKFTMALLGLLGIAGIYARQVEKAGWLGLAGYLLFSLFYALTAAMVFAEAFILPLWRPRHRSLSRASWGCSLGTLARLASELSQQYIC